MLIRIFDDAIVEFPDDLAALILADPSYGDDFPEFSIDEVNAIIHGTLGAFFDQDFTLEKNIKKVRDRYASLESPSISNLDAALASIRNYSQNIDVNDIGLVDKNLLFSSENTGRKSIDNLPNK